MNLAKFIGLLAKADAGQITPEELEKAATTANSLAIGGTLTPAAARRYYTTVVEQSEFLKRVTTEQVDAIEQDVDLFAVADRALVRVAEGTEPTVDQEAGATNNGKRWHLEPVQFFPTINFSTLINRQKQGNLEEYLAGKFGTAFRNDLQTLGCVGDSGSADAFDKLNDGWNTLIKAAVSTSDRDVAAVVSTGIDYIATMSDMLAVMPDKYKDENSTCFIMSKSDREAWVEQMSGVTALGAALESGKLKSFKGYEVIGVPNWPAGNIEFTPLANIAFGMGGKIQRYRNINTRKRAIEYTWNLYSDYLIINDDAVVHADNDA